MTSLVIGASGFLGSHVVHQLAAEGESVRAFLRRTSDTRGIDGLVVERCYGDIFDLDSVRTALRGCDTVYYCVVDARPWLRDPSPMWRTNVDGLKAVLEVAAQMPLRRFVFTSSMATIGIPPHGRATEDDHHNWGDRCGAYISTRVAAEKLVLDHARAGKVPAVAMCVANTYGAGDWLPTPHGGLLAATVRGQSPFYIKGIGSEVVGIRDAAQALVLAGRRGKVGERYIVAERYMTGDEINRTACTAVGIPPPSWGIPRPLLAGSAAVSAAISRVRRTETRLTPLTVRLMHVFPPMDHSKAVTELGWTPAPAPDSIAEAALFFTTTTRVPRSKEDTAS